MASARDEKNPYEDGGGFGKFRKRPFRRPQTTPYDRPPTALRNPNNNNNNNGWFSKLVDPAHRLITYSAHKLFSSVFRKRLPPPPPPPSSEKVQEVRDNHQEAASFEHAASESSGQLQGVVGESGVQINSSVGGELTELEKLLKQKTFTRSEIDHLTELLRSRTVDFHVGEEGKRAEVVASDSIVLCEPKEEYAKTPALENGIGNQLVSTPHVTSSVSMEDVALPTELAKAFMGSRPSKVSPSMLGLQCPPRGDPSPLKGQHFAQKSPNMSIVPRSTTFARVHENGFVTPRSRGRSAIYSMARTPYSRVYSTSTLKGAGVGVEGEPSSSVQYALGHDVLPGSKQGVLKRRSSVLDNDIGSFGPIRRIRQKSNLLSSKGLTLPHSGSPLSITRSGVGNDAAWQPSSSMLKPSLSGELKPSHMKMSAENVDDAMPSTSFPPIPSKSSEMASKILQQLDKLVSPKDKLSEPRLPSVNDKSPTKLSLSMLRGQALKSMETVDSSKLLDNVGDNELDVTLGNLSASAQKLTSKIDKVRNGPSKLVPNDRLNSVITDADATVPRNQVISILKSGDSSGTKPISSPPQKKRAFHISAHEDWLELDDDAYPNGAVSPISTSGKEATGSPAVAEKTASVTEITVQEMPSVSSGVMLSKSFTIDGKPNVKTADGSLVNEKVDVPTTITSSVADPTVKPTVAATKAATHTILGSDKSTSPNESVAIPPLFNSGNKVVPSTELTGVDAPLKESTKSGPVFGLEKAALSKEPGADASLVSFGISKQVDNVPQVPFTFSSAIGGESTGFKFGASDSKIGSSMSSTTFAGAVDSIPKVPESGKADSKTKIVSGFSAQASEPAVSSAVSTSLMASPTNLFTFGSGSNQNNGHAISTPTLSSPFPAMVTNNFTSQNIFSSPSLATSNSSISATVTSASTSMTTSTPAVIASSNSSSSTQVMASSSPSTSFFKFGSTPLPSTSLPVSSSCSEQVATKSWQDAGIGNLGSASNGSFSTQVMTSSSPTSLFKFGSTPLPSSLPVSSSGSESAEMKSKQDAGIGNLGSTSFGSSSAAGSTGSGIFGFSSSAMTTVNSQSQGSVFGSSGSVAPSSASGFTTSQSQSVAFGSSASSPLFGLTGNTAFSSGSASFPSSSPTNIFNSGTTSGQSTSASSLEANPVSSNNSTSSTLFGLSSWQPSKSPFGTSFSSSSSTSGFSFGASTPSVTSTSSSMMFGSSTGASGPQFSSTGASGPQFSFTSAAATANVQPTFGSPSPGFNFGSAPVNNDQMSMEDSMAEDTVQSTPPTVQSTPSANPLFGQQPAPVQSNFVFGASTPTGASPFQFGGQQNITPQNPSPFQATGSLEFNAGGSFSLGTGGGDKSGRKFVKVKSKSRKK